MLRCSRGGVAPTLALLARTLFLLSAGLFRRRICRSSAGLWSLSLRSFALCVLCVAEESREEPGSENSAENREQEPGHPANLHRSMSRFGTSVDVVTVAGFP